MADGRSPVWLLVAAALAGGLAGAAPPPEAYWGRDPVPMIQIPPGEFTMGTVQAAPDERPVHAVKLRSFSIDKLEVTNARYREFEHWMARHRDHSVCAPGEPKDKDHRHHDYGPAYQETDQPVVGVDWYDAFAYAGWAGKRLPTEAEWERAARGTEARRYPWGQDPPDSARVNFGERVGHPTLAGAYEAGASPDGCLDMAGNVWEWCLDWFGHDWYGTGEDLNPQGPSHGDTRVIRGGSFLDFASCLRTTFRGHTEPTVRARHIGFRCVR
ncbi:MAG: formylglycine-generating enzyme family protein [Candidatus Wallbacteria bacterium]|nr:formylglycine-generating enzyme family protein [Candidatus Wallbacteria bacterium]